MRMWLQLTFGLSLLTCILAGGAILLIVRQPTKLAAIVGHKEDPSVSVVRTIRSLGEEKLVLVLGDSITVNSELPEQICGMQVVNAGSAAHELLIPLAEEMLPR